jgi:hypothetical protein
MVQMKAIITMSPVREKARPGATEDPPPEAVKRSGDMHETLPVTQENPEDHAAPNVRAKPQFEVQRLHRNEP